MLKNNHIIKKTLLLKWFGKCAYVHYRKLLTERINFINNLNTLHEKINHKNLHTWQVWWLRQAECQPSVSPSEGYKPPPNDSVKAQIFVEIVNIRGNASRQASSQW